MNSITYKSLELLIIFILIPVSFVVSYPIGIKLCVGVFGLAYIIYILLKVECLKFSISKLRNWKLFWISTFVKFIIIALITTIYVFITDKAALFSVVVNKPMQWLVFLFIYSVFSVLPQELLYRTFFFKRYQNLFKSEMLFVFVNAILFGLAHLFFGSVLVLVFTCVGGLLFALTYHKTKSLLLVSIEHALYGSWLFTVGMGSMLGFPV